MATQAELFGAGPDDVVAARELVVTYLADRYPTLSVRVGELSTLVVGAATDALAAVDVRAAAQIASLDPETALATGGYDEDVLAAALAGRGVTRGAAAYATGSIAVHLSAVTGVTIPNNYRVYTSDGVYYGSISLSRVLAPGATATSPSDLVAVTVPEGGFAVLVPVRAAETGATANRPAGTALTSVAPVAYQTAVYAASDLAGGADVETDAALLARLPAATAPRTVASDAGAAATVEDVVPAYTTVTTVGFGHEGMRRGRSALTGQTPGRMDIRVRTSDPPARVRVPVSATLIATVPYGRWRFALDVDDAPGRFRVEKAVQRNAALTAAGYALAAVTAGYDTAADETGLDVRTAADAALSRYATLIGEFLDPDTSTAGLTVDVSTRLYDAIVRTVDGLDVAQAACDAAEARAAGGDCLVRSAVPVMVTLTVAATIASGVTLTPAQTSTAVARAINENGISQTLSASSVAARAAAYLPTGTALQLTTFVGVVYPVGSASFTISGSSGLSVSTDWTVGVGPDVVAFYADPEGVTSTVATAG